ncbi:GPI-anchored protein LLG1 [Typha angustifolia]|uniref:GPI-anchored protein LLG1 n=1 Tax=Typha angustifolia TaxID=59011 RepID=UPI003C2D936F
MGSNRGVSLGAVLFMVLVGLAACSFISDDVFQLHGSTGRSLLQAKKSCPVNFEFKNYTIITSKCKGPQYPATLCCSAFKEFACPYSTELNDATNDCASTMFSYINLYGKYPPGLFASECRESQKGLACPPSAAIDASSARLRTIGMSSLIVVMCGIALSFLFS